MKLITNLLKSAKSIVYDSATSVPFDWWMKIAPRKIILYGHLISDGHHPASERYRFPSFAEFEAFTHAVQNAGYQIVGLEDFMSDKFEKMILLTFDDGYRVIFTELHPYMQRWSLPYVVFVLTAPLGSTSFIADCITRGSNNDPLYLSEEEICQLKSDGVHIGFHTVTHCRVKHATQENNISKLLQEMKIDDRYFDLFSAPFSFAYPFEAPVDFDDYDSMLTGLGFKYIFDAKGLMPPRHNHFFRIRMDTETSKKCRNCIIDNVLIEILRYWKRKILLK